MSHWGWRDRLSTPQVRQLRQRRPRVLRRKRDCTPPSSSHSRGSHLARVRVLRRRKDWHLSLPPHTDEEFSRGGGGISPPPHKSGEYFGGGGAGPPLHNVGKYFGGEGSGPSPHNEAVYISLGLQLTARALEAVRFWSVDLCFFCEPPGVHFREHAPCPSRQQHQRGSA